MRKFRLILIVTLLSLTVLGGGLLVSASLNSPAKASTVAAKASDATIQTDDSATTQDLNLDGNIDPTDANALNAFDLNTMAANSPDLFQPGILGAGVGPEERGIISSTANSGNTLILRNKRVVNLNGQTILGDANGTISATALKAGDYIFALGTVQTDKSLQARWVLRLPAPPQLRLGQVTALNVPGNTFQFKVGNDTWTASVVSDTKIVKAGKQAGLSELAVNDEVSVLGIADDTAHTIQANIVQDGKPGPQRGNFTGGIVSTVDVAGNSFVITPTAAGPGPRAPKNSTAPADSSPVKITVSTNTKFIGLNFKSLSDLKAGDRVIITGDKQSDGSYQAKTVVRGPSKGQNGKGNGTNFPPTGTNG